MSIGERRQADDTGGAPIRDRAATDRRAGDRRAASDRRLEDASPAPETIAPFEGANRRRRGFFRYLRVYYQHMRHEPRRERLFLSSATFALTFMLVRLLTFSIHYNIGPFHNVSVGGTHVHHLVWGILLMLVVAYAWLVQMGTREPSFDWPSRLSPLAFGVAAALILDEFALWLQLKDVYWQQDGRLSVEVVALAFGLLSFGIWGGPLLLGIGRESRVVWRDFTTVLDGSYWEYRRAR
ncbi:MAG TPA: hypothetical protein VIN56_06160, partial [Candidatus Dormibacteraeota bacterium]